MKMTFRWFGEQNDSIPLQYIRQIPGMQGVVTALFDVPVGDVWPLDKIMALKKQVEDNGLAFETIESVNIHEDIKLGLPTRDLYIENYNQSIRNLAQAGIKVICYNFMPVFDWMRDELAKELPDGSNALAYDDRVIKKLDPQQLVADMQKGSNGFELPGWEPERLQHLEKLFEMYKEIDEDQLYENLKYFLEGIIPVCTEYDVKMAIHPDDPPWPIFGLPRIVTSQANLDRLIKLVDSPYNGLTICTGALGANAENDMPAIIRHFGKLGRIHFGHVRNIKIHQPGVFNEVAHKSDDSSLDMYEIMKAFHDIDFKGPIRPDHGRMIWGEVGRPGYGLYDRALGANYLQGIWDALQRG